MALSVVAVSGGLLIQIIRTIKLKASDQFSVWWIILSAVTWFSWTIYGIEAGDIYVLVANSLGFVLQVILLILILKYRKNKKKNGARKIYREFNKTEV